QLVAHLHLAPQPLVVAQVEVRLDVADLLQLERLQVLVGPLRVLALVVEGAEADGVLHQVADRGGALAGDRGAVLVEVDGVAARRPGRTGSARRTLHRSTAGWGSARPGRSGGCRWCQTAP